MKVYKAEIWLYDDAKEFQIRYVEDILYLDIINETSLQEYNKTKKSKSGLYVDESCSTLCGVISTSDKECAMIYVGEEYLNNSNIFLKLDDGREYFKIRSKEKYTHKVYKATYQLDKVKKSFWMTAIELVDEIIEYPIDWKLLLSKYGKYDDDLIGLKMDEIGICEVPTSGTRIEKDTMTCFITKQIANASGSIRLDRYTVYRRDFSKESPDVNTQYEEYKDIVWKEYSLEEDYYDLDEEKISRIRTATPEELKEWGLQ